MHIVRGARSPDELRSFSREFGFAPRGVEQPSRWVRKLMLRQTQYPMMCSTWLGGFVFLVLTHDMLQHPSWRAHVQVCTRPDMRPATSYTIYSTPQSPYCPSRQHCQNRTELSTP